MTNNQNKLLMGNLYSIVYPNNKKITYGYDELHRLTRVTDWSDNVTKYDYLFDSYIHTITYPNEAN